jgi:Uma2 family endonuclease
MTALGGQNWSETMAEVHPSDWHPSHTLEEVEIKVKEYRSAGVKLIWVVSPKARTVVIRRLDGTCAELDEAGTLSGEDVIPGFTCPVAELFV